MDWLFELLGDGISGWLDTLFWRNPGRHRSWQAAVPNLHGLPVGQARRTLSDCELCINLVRLTGHAATAGEVVVDQSPAPGERVRRQSTVTIYVQHPPAANGATTCSPAGGQPRVRVNPVDMQGSKAVDS